MKTALVDGQRREAEPSLSGLCPGCGSLMIPKCGERRIPHWAHRGERHCDHWWEPETDWHRGWKNNFPDDWQEIFHRAGNGEKHIADIKTAHGCVIEFQNSPIKPEERRAREAFYSPMVWVVNGLRLKLDKPRFLKALNSGTVVSSKPLVIRISLDRCALFQTWSASRVAVFFDFGVLEGDILFEAPMLWRLLRKEPNGDAFLVPFPVANFIDAFRTGKPLEGIDRSIKNRAPTPPPQPPRPPHGHTPYRVIRRHRRL